MHRLPQLRTASGINVTCLCKGAEKYIWLFDDRHANECLRALGRAATNRELSFTWYDAARVSQSVREAARSRDEESMTLPRTTRGTGDDGR